MEKLNNSSGDEEDYSCEQRIFAGPPPKRSANLRERVLNQLVEQRQSALGDGSKKQQTGLYQPLEVSDA